MAYWPQSAGGRLMAAPTATTVLWGVEVAKVFRVSVSGRSTDFQAITLGFSGGGL